MLLTGWRQRAGRSTQQLGISYKQKRRAVPHRRAIRGCRKPATGTRAIPACHVMCDGERTQNVRVYTLPTVEMFPHGLEMCVMPKYFAFVNAKRVAAFAFLAAAAGGLAAQADPVDIQRQLLGALAPTHFARFFAFFTPA